MTKPLDQIDQEGREARERLRRALKGEQEPKGGTGLKWFDDMINKEAK